MSEFNFWVRKGHIKLYRSLDTYSAKGAFPVQLKNI